MNNKGLTGLFVVLAFMALLLTACYEAEIENVTGSTDDLESITSVEDIINSLDIEGTHVMLNLTDQITVDADITDNSLYEDVTFDIYSIDKAEDIVSSDFYELLNEKYGETNVITAEELNESKEYIICNAIISDYHASFTLSNPMLQGGMEFISVRYPYWTSEDKMSIAMDAIEEAREILDQSFDMSEYDLVRYLHTDREWYSGAWKYGLLEDEDEECYVARYTYGINGLPVLTISSRHFYVLGGDAPFLLLENSADIYVDSEGNLEEFEYQKTFDVTGVLESGVQVVDVKEVIAKFYEEWKNKFILHDITIYNIELIYSGDVIENEDGTVQKCIRPYWILRYYGGDIEASRYDLIDAQTGEIVLRY